MHHIDESGDPYGSAMKIIARAAAAAAAMNRHDLHRVRLGKDRAGIADPAAAVILRHGVMRSHTARARHADPVVMRAPPA